VNFVKNTFQSKGYALLIALDISGAFDNAFWPIILNNLKDLKCPKNLFYLTKSYFSNRKAKLWFNNNEFEKVLTKGCPQGSSCGPGFWSILYDTLLSLRLPNEVNIQGFADDTLLMISSQTISDLETKANQALNVIYQWSIKNKLEFNFSKTVTVVFTKNINYSKPKIYLNTTELKISNSMLYLGVQLDSKLIWKSHINQLKAKSLRLVMNLIGFAKKSYGLNRKSLEIIYKGAVIPIISYGCPVWADAIDKQYIRIGLERIQRLIALRLCYAYKTVSTEALNIICNLMPIDLRLKQISIEYHIKKNINSRLVDKYIRNKVDFELISKPIDFYTLPHPAKVYKISVIEETTDDVKVFTNGYKGIESVGSGFCVLKNTNVIKKAKYKLSNYCSIFQSQLFSILKSLQFMEYKTNINNKFTIFCNMAIIRALESSFSTTELVQEILLKVKLLERNGSEILFAINNGYHNMNGYDLAKECAREGSIAHRSIDFDKIPFNYVKRVIYEKSLLYWNNRWIQSGTGSVTREYFPTIMDRMRLKKIFYPTFELTQMMTNHGKFNSYLQRFNIKEDSRCEKCGAAFEDIKHLIFQCPEYQQFRDQLKVVVEENTQWPCDLKFLLKEQNFAQFNNFCKNVLKN
jgi:hypothetical protein